MSRADGRHKKPRVAVEPDTPEGDYIGLSDRMTPGPEKGQDSPIQSGPLGGPHITNAQVMRQHVPIPVPRPEYRGIMEHGVPGSKHTTRERAEMERGPHMPASIVPKHREYAEVPAPIAVTIVERAQGSRPLRTVAGDHFTVPATGTAAIRIAGRDKTRTTIKLLVETLAGAAGAAPTGVRVDHEVGNLDTGGGFLVRAGGTSYLDLPCNDELFAVSADGSACTLSVIYLYGVPGGG